MPDSLWAGMSDGDETEIETPFGYAVFTFQEGDPDVGLIGGVFFAELTVDNTVFTNYDLEASGLTAALNRWAEQQ